MLRPRTLDRPWPVRWAPLAIPGVRITEGRVLFCAALALYLSVAAVLGLGWHAYLGDAWSRVGSAYYVLFSRDPHLAAIGFVWSPLPTLALLPLVALSRLWPALVHDGFAASIVSAIAMAGVVYQSWAIFVEAALARHLRLGLVALLALHPFVVQYGANGMSEALFMFLLVVAARALAAWLRSAETPSLVTTGIALAFGYLARYEGAAAALTVSVVVVLVSITRTRGSIRARSSAALADAVVVATPFAAVFLGWALVSWLIVGNPFEQFASVYGNAAQQAANPDAFRSYAGEGLFADAHLLARQVFGLAPALLASALLATYTLDRRGDPAALACGTILGGVLAFMALAWLTGKTGPLIRYYIVAVPLAVLFAGVTLAVLDRAGEHRHSRPVLEVLVVIAAALSLPTGAFTMADPIIGRGELDYAPSFWQHRTAQEVVHFIDSLDLPPTSVLLDVFMGFPLVLESENPKQFVITPDRDFQSALADPAGFGIRYVLVPIGGGIRRLDALRRTYPRADSGELGPMVADFVYPSGTGGESNQWRLYQVR